MTIALDSTAGGFLDLEAFKKDIRDRIASIVSEISAALMNAAVPRSDDAAVEVRQKFEARISKANRKLDDVNRALLSLIADFQAASAAVNRKIVSVKVGDNKIDRNGHLAMQLEVVANICSIAARRAKASRSEIEVCGLNCLALFDTIALFSQLEKNLMALLDDVRDLGERVAIHDALTEKPVSATDAPLLSRLLDGKKA